jgi:hypothetical protein
MLEKDKRRNCYFSIDTIIKEAKEANGTKKPTAEEVLTYMMGDSDGWRNGDYVVYKYTKSTKRTFLQRFNMLWVYPLFILAIPFQFLFVGDIGLNRNSKIGRLVDRLVKFN